MTEAVIGAAVGFALGWFALVQRVAAVLLTHLRRQPPVEVLALSNDLWWRLVPWPLNNVLDRRFARKYDDA